MDLEEFHERSECQQFEIYPLSRLSRAKPGRDISEALAWDELTGMRLKADQVIEARDKEMKYVRDMKVWERIPRRRARARNRECACRGHRCVGIDIVAGPVDGARGERSFGGGRCAGNE